ncbi:MAG TPA: protein kinase [Polyangiaceae bacterium]|nr:protein kinase [Polyangiaceae bacterium]
MNAPAPPAGSVIAGKYRVERVLGSGGMAVVLEATHMILGQRVAIKLLRADAAQAPSVLERFRQEAQIAAQLPGDHIVRVTDVGQAETGAPFIVMELMLGRDLEAEILARGCLPMEEAVDVILQACEGVAEAHAVGLVHRDLKPGNLFVMRRRDGSPQVKVLDFGITKLTRREDNVSLTQATDNFGTPLYMSPEQIQSVKHVDARSDQHALAAILYTLLAGRPPWNAPTVTALSVLIATHPPPGLRGIRPDVPSRLEQVLARALAKHPGERFADLAAFAYALVPFGSAGAQASVRRIASALTSAPGATFDPRTSDPALGGVPRPSPSNPGFGPEMPGLSSSGLHTIPRGVSSNPGVLAPPAIMPPPFAAPRGPMGQTSSALTTALGSDRGASGRRFPLAVAIVSLTALSVAVIVALALVYFNPKRTDDPSAQAASESSAAPASAATIAPAAQPSEPPKTEPSAAPEPTPPAPEAAPAATGSVAPVTDTGADTGTVAGTGTGAGAGTVAPKPVTAAPKPTTKPSTSPKKRDPRDVFGAKR